MNRIRRQVKTFSMAAFALTMLALLFAGTALPAQAQTYPVAFPHPSTFLLNNNAGSSDGYLEAAAVGDFTGNGKLDVVSVQGGSYFEIDVALGNGDGTFQYPPVENLFPAGPTARSIAVGDFNGDGLLDVAIWWLNASGNTSDVTIFLGNGNGTFTQGGTYAAPNSTDLNPGPNSLYVADFNGDGKLDLAALTPYNGVFIYLGNGDGTFQTAVGYSTVDPNHPNNTNAFGMAVGDLNGDGKPDIAVTENSGMAVLLNNGNGTFGTATYYDSGISPFYGNPGIAIGALTTNKENDIVITGGYGQILLYLNQGKGKFAVKGVVAKLAIAPWLVSIADINGDKKLDLVVTDSGGEIFTYYGKGNGTFTTGPVYPLQVDDAQPSALVLADFNGDGALDIFKAGDQWVTGLVMLGRGDGTFQSNQAYGWSYTGFGNNLVTADFNGDGFPDVAFSFARSNNLPAFGVMLGSSHGALAAPTYVTYLTSACSYSYPEWIATGDVNGDGKADIVATIYNYESTGCPVNEVAVFTGLGTGKFKAPVFYPTGSTAQSYDVFLADVNGDGKPDIVISNADGTISVLLNKGTGTFGTANLITSVAALNPHLNSLAIGDFNGDGKLDIAVATYNQQDAVYVLLGNGDGTFQAPIATTTPGTSYALAAGDFTNDGKTDLLVTLSGSCYDNWHGYAAYAFLKGNGDGTFTAGPMNCTNGNYPVYPVVADFNGDGKLDAFVPMLQEDTSTAFGPVLLQGNGDGTFNRIGGPYSPVQWWGDGFYVGQVSVGAAVADFNGDGMPDIAVLNNDSLYIEFATVMFNSTQPVSVSPLVVNYGNVAVGASKSETVVLTNDQSTSLTIDSITISGADASDFTATSNCGTSRKAGWDCTITVKYTAAVTGGQTATLNITDSAGTQTVQLNAGVNPKPAITSLAPSSALAGGSGFTLTVNGTGFISSSVVNWAGSPRATTFVSATEITAAITAADIAKAGTFKVTVTNPAPGGGTTAASNFVVDNPAPTLTSISPNSATHGGAAFTLTATGTGYVAASVIEWNAKKLTTTYVSGTTLTATVPAADIKTAGTANVTVVNPTPGGGTSAAKTFTIN